MSVILVWILSTLFFRHDVKICAGRFLQRYERNSEGDEKFRVYLAGMEVHYN